MRCSFCQGYLIAVEPSADADPVVSDTASFLPMLKKAIRIYCDTCYFSWPVDKARPFSRCSQLSLVGNCPGILRLLKSDVRVNHLSSNCAETKFNEGSHATTRTRRRNSIFRRGKNF